MSTPFELHVGCEYAALAPGRTTAWAAIRIEPRTRGVEDERAPLALVLVVDRSGSMKGDPIAHVRTSCALLADLLGERDQLAVVAFSDHAGVLHGLAPVDAAGRAALRAALATLDADHGTNLHAGLQVAAGLLATAPAGLRRAMVVMSDGQPNIGLASATELAAYVAGLRPLGVSALGFGVHHDENVLAAIATAGSGRYAYVADPVIARVELARAALAHGGIVADSLELIIEPADDVELVRLVPAAALRLRKGGAMAAIGDIFVDEGRLYAVELALELGAGHRGRLAQVTVRGRSPDGAHQQATAVIDVDVRAGAPAVDAAVQREVLTVEAEAARVEARAQADRGAAAAAAAILRAMIVRVDGRPWFVANDGSPLAELREQLVDEAANHERAGSDVERAHRRKQAVGTQIQATVAKVVKHRQRPAAAAFLVGVEGQHAGVRFPLMDDNVIGRGTEADIAIGDVGISRMHARVVAIDDAFVVLDLGSTNGVQVNGADVHSHPLADGDVVRIGGCALRFER